MSDKVMSKVLQLAHERHTDSPDPLCPRCVEEWGALHAQLAEANTRIETLTRRLEAAQERAEAWEEAALGKTGKQSFDEMERSWREAVVRAEETEQRIGVLDDALERSNAWAVKDQYIIGVQQRKLEQAIADRDVLRQRVAELQHKLGTERNLLLEANEKAQEGENENSIDLANGGHRLRGQML